MNHLKIESAIGNGEYLIAYIELCGCPSKTYQLFTEKIKGSFQRIYLNESQDLIYRELQNIIQTNKVLTDLCKATPS